MSFAPEEAKHGHLPPWELAKAAAYDTVLQDVEAHTGIPAAELVGERVRFPSCAPCMARSPSKVRGGSLATVNVCSRKSVRGRYRIAMPTAQWAP